MKEIIKNFNLHERHMFFFISVFVFLNWILLFNIEKLAPPDYYHYYSASENLFSGDLKLGFIPPLFPFFLGLFGRVLKLIGFSGDTFILGGRIISLFSGIGVAFFTHKLLKKFVYQFASFATIFLIISPFFLKLLVLPQTDMLYLFFVSAAIYFFSFEKFKFSYIWSFLGGLLTRFEGILLIGSAFINYFDRKRKQWIYISISLIPITFFLYFFFFKLARYLIIKINFVFSKGLYLNFFKHPMDLVHLLYGNILYFISPKFPSFLKWTFFYLLLIAFFSGVYYLFKHRRQFVVSILFYLITFIIFKGYMKNIDPEIGFRRMLSPIWIFYIVAFIGIYFLFKKASELKKIFFFSRITFYLFLFVASLLLPFMKGNFFLIIILLVPVVFFGIRKVKISKVELVSLFGILLIFFGQLYFESYKKTYNYVSSVPNKAGFAIAQWLKKDYIDKNRLVIFSFHPMIRYYFKKPIKIRYFVLNDESIYRDREKLLTNFFKKSKKYRIKYVVFDMYLNVGNRPWEAALKILLLKERDRGVYFSVKTHLTYRGKYVATVLKPLYENFNRTTSFKKGD